MSRLSEDEEKVGLYIIGNLAAHGFLALSLDEVCEATGGASETAEAVLKKIQFFDPPGVAARDLRECLLIQLQNLGLADSLAARIVSDHLAQLENRRFEKLARELGITVDEIVEASQVIASLEPRPARGYDEEEIRTIIPDVSVEKISGEWVIFLNDEGLPRLRVSSFYRRLAGQQGEEEDKARLYLQEKVRAATWLIKSIHQR